MLMPYHPANLAPVRFTPAYYRRLLEDLRPAPLKHPLPGDFPNTRQLDRLFRIPKGMLPTADSEFLKEYLQPGATDFQLAKLLKVLCHLGHPAAQFLPAVGSAGPIARRALMNAAAEQGDPETVAAFAADMRDAHSAIVTLKQMGRMEYATALLLSDNRELVELIRSLL
ncbi:MAG: hypothetical protein II943_00800 [Victivallales bacterium]|nr:hypothetical protein [Victivallales bacterium]